jgi:hypothetical protein
MSFDQDKRLRTYALTDFEQYPGLTIHCREPGYRATKELGAAVLVLGDDLMGQGLAGDALLDAFEPLFTAMGRSITRWNLLDGGVTVPLSQLQDQDLEFLLDITRTWYEVVVQGKRPQLVDNPVDDQLSASTEPLAGQDGSILPTVGEDGTDEEWLTQFASFPPLPVDPDTNEPWPVPDLKYLKEDGESADAMSEPE